jgi:hypothetical protein
LTRATLVEQNARLALEISHRVYVFEIGKIALDGESRALSEDPRIKKGYLGAYAPTASVRSHLHPSPTLNLQTFTTCLQYQPTRSRGSL